MKVGEDIPAPFFVIGSSRSGTTYLQRVLNQHPKLFITHETRVMAYVNRALNDIPADDRAILARRDDWLKIMRRSFPDLVYRFYRKIGAPKDARWGDKNPHYADPKIDPACLTTIDELFPDSQFVHIIRDGRAVVASVLEKGWALNVDYAMDIWRRHILHARSFGDKIGPKRFLEVKHEDLVADGIGATSEILEWLGVGPDDAVSDFLAEQDRERTPISRPTSDLGKQAERPWEGRLDPETVTIVEHGLADLLVELGYETQEWRDALGEPPSKRPPVQTALPNDTVAAPAIDLDALPADDLEGRVKLLTDLVEDRNRQVSQIGMQLEAQRVALESSRKKVDQLKGRVQWMTRRQAKFEARKLVKVAWRATRLFDRIRTRGK